MSRGRAYSQNRDWDPMRDDFEDSEAQYPEDDAGSGGNLDHCRLYITNIPKALNDEGLRTAFSKYGTLVEVFVSKDPTKKYGLVAYETPGEAKLAMMKLNRTEPLKLNISIAYKKKLQEPKSRDSRERVNGTARDRSHWEDRDGSSASSRRGKQEESHAGDPVEERMEQEVDLAETLDPDLHLELEQLKLQQLKIQQQEIQCKQRMLLLKEASKRPSTQSFGGSSSKDRCFLPDGRIVVRNVEKSADSREQGEGYTGGAGDARAASRSCVSCARAADSYCVGCGITPYCSDACQRKDWEKRHRHVCHNLASLAPAKGITSRPVENDVNVPAPAPLRRPRSPAVQLPKSSGPTDRQNGQEKFMPPGTRPEAVYNNQNRSNYNRLNKYGNRKAANMNGDRNNQDGNRDSGNRGNQDGNRGNFGDRGNRNFNRTGKDEMRRPQVNQSNNDDQKDEDWGPVKPKPQSQEPQPTSQSAPKAEVIQVLAKTQVKPDVVKTKTAKVAPPLSVADVTPTKKIVPKNYILETLNIGDTALISVENEMDKELICMCMHDSVQEQYQSLCEEYSVDCEADEQVISPQPGETFSLLNPEDSGWYRARMLNKTEAALLDANKIVKVDVAKKLPVKYAGIPEFSCVIRADVKVGDTLKCTILSNSPQGYKVSIENMETGANVGEGLVTRWMPKVEYPEPVKPTLPVLDRPQLTNNSKVILIDVISLDKAIVLDVSKQREYDNVLQNGALIDNPLKEPPAKGQVVVGKFTDGLCYRALVKRTNVKSNKYMIEYVEFGNEEVTCLEKLHECPPELHLSAVPCVTSSVKLCNAMAMTPQATEYIEALKDSTEQLILTLPSGEAIAPSGSEAILTVCKNNEQVNRKLQLLCAPEWHKISDVVETAPVMFNDLKYISLPLTGCELDVLYIGALQQGNICACLKGDKTLDIINSKLMERITEYCNSDLCKEPYLPKPEELCIAKWPVDDTWYRAVLLELTNGPGSSEAQVLFIDYGNVETVPCSGIRKMLQEFVEVPCVASHLDIHDFALDPTPDMLARALQYLQINDEGRGTLKVDKLEKQSEEGVYTAYASGLINAMSSQK